MSETMMPETLAAIALPAVRREHAEPVGPDVDAPLPAKARVTVSLPWDGVVRVRVGSCGDGAPLATLELPRWVYNLPAVRDSAAAFVAALQAAEAPTWAGVDA